jgi:hypothetical protein
MSIIKINEIQPTTGTTVTTTGNVTITGNATVAGTISGSAVSGTTFHGDGSNLTNLPGGGGGGTPGGSDTQVQFNSGSAFSGSSGLTFNYSLNNLTVGNEFSASYVSASTDIIAGRDLSVCYGTASLHYVSGCSTITVLAPISSSMYISASTYYGDGGGLTNIAGHLTVQEQDGSPIATAVTTLKFSNSTVTEDSPGVVSIDIATSGSWFRPASSICTPDTLGVLSQGTHNVTGSLFTPTTTFSSSNSANISVVSQTYIKNTHMQVVLSSSAVSDSVTTLYAYNGAQQDDSPTTVSISPTSINPPMIYFTFEEGTGVDVLNHSNTTFVSGSESAVNITGSFGGQWFSETSVRGSYCAYFDGNGGRIPLPEYPNYNMIDMLHSTGSFTISLWMRSNGTAHATHPHDYNYPVGALLDIRGHYTQVGYGLGLPHSSNDRVNATKKSSSTQGYYPTMDGILVPGGTDMVKDTWYHVLFTCDSSTNQFLYFNGTLIGNISVGTAGDVRYTYYNHRYLAGGTDTSMQYHLKAGNYQSPADPHYNGLLDEFALFDYFMTPEQVAWIYNDGSPPSLADGVPDLP